MHSSGVLIGTVLGHVRAAMLKVYWFPVDAETYSGDLHEEWGVYQGPKAVTMAWGMIYDKLRIQTQRIPAIHTFGGRVSQQEGFSFV